MATSAWVVGRPAPRLRPVVDRYVGYRMAGLAPGVHRGLPSGRMTFIVSIDHEIDVVRQTSDAQAPRAYRTILSGLHAAPALIGHDGFQQGVAIELTPLGARVLFGVPAGALWDLTLEVEEVAGSVGDELWERLHHDDTWGARFATCDDVLGQLVGDHATAEPVAGSWQMLAASHGQVPVADVARELGWSRQHLTRRFRAEFGLGPKLAARILRFERATRMLQATPSFVSLAEVAASCGYADQGHLTRDFTAFAGCPPTRWLQDEEVPNLQDADAAPVGG